MNYLAIDVGGTFIKYALVDKDYQILEKGEVPTPQDTLENFKQTIKSIYEKYQDQVLGIGMSLPGMINEKTQKMQVPGALLYNANVDVLKELKSVTTEYFTIENDAKSAALCEVVLGSLKDTKVGAVCLFGTGIGGSITIGNKVLKGAHGFAGEFSFISTAWKKKPTFGFSWAAETSTKNLTDLVQKYCQLDEVIDGRKAFELCNAGHPQALTALREFCDEIAVGLYNIQAYVDPDKIAIGGGISKQPLLKETIQKCLDDIYESIPIPIPRVNLTTCKFYNDSNLLGAVVNYRQQFE